MITYTLIRSSRKTVAIYVRNNSVEVRAPLKVSKRDIDRFVLSKEEWITGKLAKSLEQSEKREAFSLNYGCEILYRGKLYPLTAKDRKRIGFDETAFYIPPSLTPQQIKAACIQMYRTLAKRYLTLKTFEYAKQMSVIPANVKVNNAKTRWGSCSTNKNINFSWRLIMAEDEVIDYVVVHELAHLTEMNHSARFWAIVENTLPDYRQRKAKLKILVHKLNGEDW